LSSVTRSDDIKQGIDMATVGVNYRFGGPVIAKYWGIGMRRFAGRRRAGGAPK
jgi:hypothetical protein